MHYVSATEAGRELGSVLDKAQRTPVTIRKRDRDFAVLLSATEWDERETRFHTLERRIRELETYIEVKRSQEEAKANPSTMTSLSELCARYNVAERQAAT